MLLGPPAGQAPTSKYVGPVFKSNKNFRAGKMTLLVKGLPGTQEDPRWNLITLVKKLGVVACA